MQVDRKLVEQIFDALVRLNRTGDTQVFDLCDAPEILPALQATLAKPIIEPEIKNDKPWHGLTDEERDYFKACGFVGVSRVEEVLRAKNT